jgi:TonB family protein
MQRLWIIALVAVLVIGLVHAQQTTQAADAPVPSDQWAAKNITRPELISGEKAEYPFEARFQQIDGLCSISLVVGIDGDPQNIHIIHCTDPSFEETSLEAVKQYKFKPATTQEGKPVPVTIPLVHRYHVSKYSLSLRLLFNWPVSSVIPDKRLNLDHHPSKADVKRALAMPIHYGFIPQRGGASEPDSDGVYPFTRSVTGPRVIKFSDVGYGGMAFAHEGHNVCEVVLTISEKGKATDPHVTHCERPELEESAIKSLLKSEYEPGFVKGKAVPMRASIHLEYGSVPPKS